MAESMKNLSGGDKACAFRSGMVAMVGRANVGKSSIVNALMEEKVSIVSHVEQTTRNRIRSVYSCDRGQVVLLDTPGIHKASSDLGRLMNRAARASIDGVDAVALVFDPSIKPRDEDEGWMSKLTQADVPLLFIMNKHDLPCPYAAKIKSIWAAITDQNEAVPPVIWHEVSAATGEGIELLREMLLDLVPVGPPLFPEAMLTDYPRKLAIADVIREQYFQVLRDEVPHDLAVRVSEIEEKENEWRVYADILVNRASQKGIVIGDRGRMLRRVKRAAERELGEMYEHPVVLNLWVKVEKNWSKNYWILKQLGYN